MKDTAQRVAVWLLTGPVGRFSAFLAELAIAWWRWASARVRGRPY